MADDALEHDLLAAYSRHLRHRARRRRLLRTIVLASAVLAALAGAAFGTALLLGWPAPEHVKREIAAVDRGMPEDLRLNPDVEHAVAVAATETSTLYAATLRGGGSCTEIVTPQDRGRGATCTTAGELGSRPIEVTLPFDDGSASEAPVVLGGRVNERAGKRLEIVYADGSADDVPLGDDRYFLFDVPSGQVPSVRADGFALVARDADGAETARTAVPGTWDDPARPDREEPIYVSTHSDESDLTKVYGFDGFVGAGAATQLALDYGDGTRVTIPIRDDRSYDYTVPPDRVDAFMAPRKLEALDGDGAVVASTWVAAVAYWRGRHE